MNVELNSTDELEQKIFDATVFAIKTSIENPIFIKTYFRYKSTENIFGITIEKFENLWIEKFSKHLCRVLKITKSDAYNKCRALLVLRLAYSFDLAHRKLSKKEFDEQIKNLVHLQKVILAL